MRKPATPGPDPDEALDSGDGARVGQMCTDVHLACGEGTQAAGCRNDPGSEANQSEAWLVEHARRGDHQAFAILVRRYERKLIRVLTRLVQEPEQARDLAQDTFWRVYASLDRFDTARRFGPWLFRVGINLGLDWLRHRKIERSRAISIDCRSGSGHAAFELLDPDPRTQGEIAQEVQFILSLMPVSYRTVLVLRDLEGFSSSEIAAIMGRREATVRWKLCLARDKFREIWERRQDRARRAASAHGDSIGESIRG